MSIKKDSSSLAVWSGKCRVMKIGTEMPRDKALLHAAPIKESAMSVVSIADVKSRLHKL